MSRRPLPVVLLLAVLLAAGFATVWSIAGGYIFSVLLSEGPAQADISIRRDGTPLLRHLAVDHRRAIFTYTDLDGRPIEIDGSEDLLVETPLARTRPHDTRPIFSWSHRLRRFFEGRSQPTCWYAISDGQPGGCLYFAAYDLATKLPVGFIGRSGFRESQPGPEECFPFSGGWLALQTRISAINRSNNGRWKVFVAGDDGRLYAVDLTRRAVSIALSARHLDSCSTFQPEPNAPQLLAVRADGRIAVFDADNKELRNYTIPSELADVAFRWAEIAPGKSVARWQTASINKLNVLTQHLLWFNEAGQSTRQESIELPRQRIGHETTLAIAALAPIPIVHWLVAYWFYPNALVDEQVAADYGQPLRASLAIFWPGMMLTALLAVALAVLALRRESLFAGSLVERIVWPLFILITGLPGWIGYRYARRWPALERCPSCGAVVPRNRVECTACRHDFPLPASMGVEVFAT